MFAVSLENSVELWSRVGCAGGDDRESRCCGRGLSRPRRAAEGGEIFVEPLTWTLTLGFVLNSTSVCHITGHSALFSAPGTFVCEPLHPCVLSTLELYTLLSEKYFLSSLDLQEICVT